MKKIILLTAVLLYSMLSFAQDLQEKEVPSVVLNSFKQKFAKATDVEWELKNNLYKVEFEIARIDHEAWLNTSGQVVKTKQDLKANDLPKAISSKIASQYKGYRIDDVDKIEEGGKVKFKVELKKAGSEQNVYFDADGNVLKTN